MADEKKKITKATSQDGWLGYGQFAPVGRNTGVENPFAGTDYELQWENNPYKDMYYQPEFWDYVGLSSKAKDANAEYQRLYNEYVAGLYDQQRQDNYNSETSQVLRQKQAGLNPDLNGVESSSTSSMSAPNGGPLSALNGVSPAQSALSTITSVLGFATSTLQQIESIQGLSVDNFTKFQDAARPHIVNEYANRLSGGDANNWSDITTLFARQYPLMQRKKAKKAFTSLLGSSHFTAVENAYSQLNSNDKVMNMYIHKMGELAVLADKHKYNGDISHAIYSKSYFDNMDGSKMADYDKSNAKSNAWLTKWRHEYYSMLYDEMKKGSKLAGLILIGSNIPSSVIGGASTLLNTGLNLTGRKMFGLK